LPLARDLTQRYPDRIVWGSDWPHVGQMTTMPATTPLLNLLESWVPDEAQRRRILVDNASALYGFGS
jgi:2-pyrone-4,6-dicarboxylate lactonase